MPLSRTMMLLPLTVACTLAACGGGTTIDTETAAIPSSAARGHVQSVSADAPVPGEPVAAETTAAPSLASDPTHPITSFSDADGASAPSRMQALGVSVDKAGTYGTAIDPTDIVYALNPADLTTYRYSTLACLGGNKYWWDWGGSQGRYLSTTLFPLRDEAGAMRAGVVPDPGDAGALAFEFSVMPTDGDTSGAGNKRCEIALGWKEFSYPGKTLARTSALPRNRDFWWTLKFRLSDWRATSDRQVIFQWLNEGASASGPMLALDIWGDKLRLELHHDFNSVPSSATTTRLIPWLQSGWQPDRWYTVAIKARIDSVVPANGRVAMWLDGAQTLDYRGPIGYASPSGAGDFAKFGLYHWTIGNPWDMKTVKRTAWYKGPALILDRAGYDAARIAAAAK